VRQAVDDHVILHRLLQVEGLDRYPFAMEPQPVASVLEIELQTVEQTLVADRPADVGSQR
jgi:hypothetical protein